MIMVLRASLTLEAQRITNVNDFLLLRSWASTKIGEIPADRAKSDRWIHKIDGERVEGLLASCDGTAVGRNPPRPARLAVTACRQGNRWLLFSTCLGTLPLVQEEWGTAGSDDSPMQSDYEMEREAGATPDPSWHSETDASASSNTPREIAQHGYRGTRAGERVTLAQRL